MALLGVGQLHVQLLEARLAGRAALLQLLQLGVDLGQFLVQLRAALLAGLGLLSGAAARPAAGGRGSAPRWPRGAAPPGAAASLKVLGAGQRAARLVGDQASARAGAARCSISCARASRPACSESGA
jgi:hypothetical protein